MTGPLLFIGDSITDAGRREDPDGLGSGWVRMAAEELRDRGEDRAVVNRGIGGDRVVDLTRRWPDDVIAEAPSVLTVAVGINDTWRRYDSGDPTDVADFERGYSALLQSAIDAAQPRLILVEPYLLPVSEEQREYFDDLDPKRDAVLRLAERFGAVWIPAHEVLTAAARDRGAPALAGDGVHPTAAGARIIADAWLAGFGQL